jgi:hypothetical protein
LRFAFDGIASDFAGEFGAVETRMPNQRIERTMTTRHGWLASLMRFGSRGHGRSSLPFGGAACVSIHVRDSEKFENIADLPHPRCFALFASDCAECGCYRAHFLYRHRQEQAAHHIRRPLPSRDFESRISRFT